MDRKQIRYLIITLIVIQFLWFMISPGGNHLAPRSPEMFLAVRAYQTNPSAATKAAMFEQARRDDVREDYRKSLLFSLMLLPDAAVIYFFWNYGAKKAAA